jgi:hypothetical protein
MKIKEEKQKKIKKALIIGSVVMASLIGGVYLLIQYKIKNKK